MRHWPVTTVLIFIIATILAPPVRAQQKPFSQQQVEGMVRDGFGDESGAKLIEQRGIDFAPTEDFYQTLKAAGASEAFLNALRAAKPPEPPSAKKPINQVQVFALLVGQVPSHRVTMLVQERGIDFDPTNEYLQEVRLAGGEDELISALKSAKVTKPATVDPAAQARQSEVRQHVARGAELANEGQYAAAEQEYRSALALDSQNDGVYVSLAYVLTQQKKWDDAESAAREAVRLNPDNDAAHNNLGVALGQKGDLDEEMTEEREALRLNPNNERAHAFLGDALGKKRDLDGAMEEYREALRLNPNNDAVHVKLGDALLQMRRWEDSESEYRKALRLNPKNEEAHLGLGHALGGKGDFDGAIFEYREVVRLNPKNDDVHIMIGQEIQMRDVAPELELIKKGQTAQAILLHEAEGNRHLDEVIFEFREAVRLNPNNALAYFLLGSSLEKKGDRVGALEEYRAAYTLDPTDADYKEHYERLLHHLKK